MLNIFLIVSGLTCKRGERVGERCMTRCMTLHCILLPRLCAVLNKGIFGSGLNSDNSYSPDYSPLMQTFFLFHFRNLATEANQMKRY